MAIVEDYIEEEDTPRQPLTTSRSRNTGVEAWAASLSISEDLLRVDRMDPKPTSKIDQQMYDSVQALQALKSNFGGQRDQLDTAGPELLVQLYVALLRLDGDDEWVSKSGRMLVKECVELLPPVEHLNQTILTTHVKQAFGQTSHPELNSETSRRLARPAGGEAAKTDMYDGQAWKEMQGFGMWNVLRWSIEAMPEGELVDNIGLVLPPLLILLDDYESVFRLRGMDILEVLLVKVKPVVLKRMGIDKLFLQSIQHSISLHPTHPSPILLPRALELLFKLLDSSSATPIGSTERANEIAKAVEAGIINGWQYAANGWDGLDCLVGVALAVKMLCDQIGVGVVRWLKILIPSLLAPFFLPISPVTLLHQLANLTALHAVLQATGTSGRAARWRGQILDAVGRVWLGVSETLDIGVDDRRRKEDLEEVKRRCIVIVVDLMGISPSIKAHELPEMLAINEKAFAPLVSAV